jgi:hypothetical protein
MVYFIFTGIDHAFSRASGIQIKTVSSICGVIDALGIGFQERI